MQSLYQPQQFLYIRWICTAVDHVSIEEDHVRGLFLDFCDQPGVLPAKRFPVKVGEENNADGTAEILQGNGIGFSADMGVAEKNRKKNGEADYRSGSDLY